MLRFSFYNQKRQESNSVPLGTSIMIYPQGNADSYTRYCIHNSSTVLCKLKRTCALHRLNMVSRVNYMKALSKNKTLKCCI